MCILGFLAALTYSVGEVGFGCAPFSWLVRCPHPKGALGGERKGAAGSPRDDGHGQHNSFAAGKVCCPFASLMQGLSVEMA